MHSLLQVKLQATGHNRALQRNKISCVLEDFCAVQEEADRLDTNLVANLQVSESMFSRILEQEDSKEVEKTLAVSRETRERDWQTFLQDTKARCSRVDQSFKEQEEAIRKKYQDLLNSC